MSGKQEMLIKFVGSNLLPADAEKLEDELRLFFIGQRLSVEIEDNITGNTTRANKDGVIMFLMDGNDCKTPCPYGKNAKVMSYGCQHCENYRGQVDEYQICCEERNNGKDKIQGI